MKIALLLQFWKIPLGGNKKREAEIARFTFRSRAAPVSTSVQLWACSPCACICLLKSVFPFAPACSVSASSQGREPQTPAFNLSKGSSGSETRCANLPCLMGALGPALKYWVAEKESVMGDQFEMVNRLSKTVPGNTFFFWVIFMWEHEEGKQGKLTSVFTWN